MASPEHLGGGGRSATGVSDALEPPAKGITNSNGSAPRSTAERRYLIGAADSLGTDLVRGYVESWPALIELTDDGLVVRRRRKARGRVGLVIGNGVGHEPAMLGLVGTGLFDVNVPGDVFAAPAPTAIARGIARADRGAGVLVCVSNHAGDVLSAEMAVEMAARAGVQCRMVVLGEDVSTGGASEGGRRGGAGLFFVWKIVGAAAEAGRSLDDCYRIAKATSDQTGSLSATIRGTVNPATGQPTVAVPDGRVLLGSGVHGDGAGELLEWPSADDLARVMLERITSAIGLGRGDRCLSMVNDGGAMSVAETTLVHASVVRRLTRAGVDVVGSWVGRYATTLATAGLAVACCKVDDELLALWRAPCRSAAIASWGVGPVG